MNKVAYSKHVEDFIRIKFKKVHPVGFIIYRPKICCTKFSVNLKLLNRDVPSHQSEFFASLRNTVGRCSAFLWCGVVIFIEGTINRKGKFITKSESSSLLTTADCLWLFMRVSFNVGRICN